MLDVLAEPGRVGAAHLDARLPQGILQEAHQFRATMFPPPRKPLPGWSVVGQDSNPDRERPCQDWNPDPRPDDPTSGGLAEAWLLRNRIGQSGGKQGKSEPLHSRANTRQIAE